MLRLLFVALWIVGMTFGAAAQMSARVDWQDLALRAQQTAAREQVSCNNMIAGLEQQLADLRAQLAALTPKPALPEAPPK